MVQGTTSDAGKSTLVAALCRIYARKQLKVAPFKPQNMALNSAVTPDGGEIGRAQAVQAQAANVELSTDFNPVLLKPQSDTFAQVIINGKALPAMDAQHYHEYKKVAAGAVFSAHRRLTSNYQRVVVEGAGSPAEINLRKGDIANMGFAEEADCPVIIIADIDKGGVFAHLVGTLALLSESEQNRVVGFVINRFRGDIKLLESGLTWLENKTNKPVLGVLPYIHGLTIASEDAVVTEQVTTKETSTEQKIKVVVPVTPLMSNHNDFDLLRVHPDIDITFVKASEVKKIALPPADLIILAGSKNVIADLEFIKTQGWHHDINKHLRYGGKVFGICGGYQMLGKVISDPLAIEGQQGEAKGFGFLNVSTEIKPQKILTNRKAKLTLAGKTCEVSGYEIHAGETINVDNSVSHATRHCTNNHTIITYDNGDVCGATSNDGQVAGCYLHGIFDQPQALQILTSWCNVKITKSNSLYEEQEIAINRLADECERYLDLEKLEELISQWGK